MSLSSSYLASSRVQWMISVIEDSLGLKAQLIEEAFISHEKNKELLELFLIGDGPSKIFIYYQVHEQAQNDDIKDTGGNEPTLFINYGDKERLKEKAVFFFRNQPPDVKVKKLVRLENACDDEILFGEITNNTVPHLNHMMEYIYSPFIENLKTQDWGQTEEEAIKEFQAHTNKFAEEVHEAIGLMSPGQELFKLDQDEMQRFNTSANEGEKISYFEKKFSQWISHISSLLQDDTDLRKDKPEDGPHTELEYWRSRMQKITNWNEQLKSKDFQLVKITLQRHKQHEGQSKRGGEENIAKCLMEYNRLDLLLTDKLNEAKDNVKYLTTLEKFIEPLYKGNSQQIIDTLPALMNAIKMIHTIARFYNTADKMTGLFMKITNQMIRNCKERILNGKKIDDLWKRDPAELIEILGSCIKLYREYKSCYTETKDKVADMPKGKTFDFSETQIFGKFEAFVRRLQKLIDIFSNIQQFRALAKHNLEDMDKLTNKFDQIIESFKKNRHDLLDTSQNKFDRDWVEFNVEISKLDVELQNFIDNNFTRFKNIEYSLKLLRKFESTIKRDSLKHNLQSKYNAILQNYATELDCIQRAFQDQKLQPPIVRNMPPEAGKIIWSRHLFQKITGPISLFPENVINSAEIRKYYASYNSLGKQLTIYETWYYQNWINEIERSKAALQATLIVRHEENKKLYVNFDLEIMQLIREAKCLDRQTIEIPESARIILLQEEKFKMYYNELLYALKEYERIISKIKPICKALLAPHVEDLELKLRPGMVTLTWTSMNIDSYLFHVHQGLKKLEQLIINVNDIIENRIENNLKNVSKVILVSLPQDTKPLTLDNFVQMQNDYIESKQELLMSKNVEVERAVDDLLQTILLYPLDPHVDPVIPEETRRIKRYYFWYFYQALLNSTQNSLNSMKYRVCGKKTTGSNQLQNLKPFFEVDVQLDLQEVKLSPSLDMIQRSINKAATAVLRCSKALYNWEQSKDSDKKATFYDMIAQDKEIVKVILLLTGSIQGTKNKVNEFLDTFNKYDWLCKDSIIDSIKKFTKKHPTLQQYEDQLKKFSEIEDQIDSVDEIFKIGAMQLLTKNIKESLKFQSKDWKKEYSETLHKKARLKLDELTEKTKYLSQKLQKEVTNIDALGDVMRTLEEIRIEQAQIELNFTPVYEMYALLDNYLQGGISDKDEMDARSMLKRNWDQLITQSQSKSKVLQVQQRDHLKDLKQQIKEFVKDVAIFRKEYEKKGPMVEGISPDDAMERLRRFEEEYWVKNRYFLTYKNGEELFGLQKQTYPELEKTEAEIKNLNKLYNLYDTVIKSMNNFRDRNWQDITKDELLKMEEDAIKYGDQCVKLPKDLKEWAAYKELKKKIDSLKDVLPLVTELKKQSIKDRHWIKICEVTGKKLNYDNPDQMLIEDLLQANLLQYQEDVLDIAESADKQLKIAASLDEISAYWADAEFAFVCWGKRESPCMLAGGKVGEIIERLDEDQMTLSTLNANRHVTPFKGDVETKIKIFSDVNETLDQWINVQKLWSSLEPVFTGGDIAKAMPVQAKNFIGIDKNWMKIMEKSVETKKVIQCCANDMLKDFLPNLQEKLEDCQKSLESYLEDKRKRFPRFYFVSNPTLLKILSQGSNPNSVQEDLEKLFDAINEVTFEKNMEKKGSNEQMITAITQKLGLDNETINLRYIVKCENNIEQWLKALETNMQSTLLDIARAAAISVLNQGLRDFCKNERSQIALLGIQILWTLKVNEGLEKLSKNEKNAMESKRKEVSEMMSTLTAMCLEEFTSSVERLKTETLVTIMVHQKDITLELKSKDINDFEWQKQTRIIWNNEIDNCQISITDWDAIYSYEFLGAKERLCITPLTDRCYITLAQAMSMHYGGAPAGPAGTGKTETVKDMGRSLGVCVIVTNCGDQHRYRDMAKIFKGLVQSGLWGCFDEFNRIDLEVLSVVAMQVEAITTARKQHMNMFFFPEEEKQIELLSSVSYFITMNPGYAGRQELPENLKVLFRGVTMMVPDREIIMKVKLASVGYTAIDALAKKFNVLYKLCEEQLSKQRHYDFGLRNILSVLRAAGNTKRLEQKADEEMLIMRSLRDMNLSKLVADDIPLFNGLLLDIFPKQTSVPKKVYPSVEKMIPQIFNKSKYTYAINSDSYQLKIIQLYENSLVRHGFMMVGPSGTGKTTIMNILTDCLSDLNLAHRIIRLNPKAITAQQMYGVKSEISDDWIPGIFSTIWEKSNKRSNKWTTWITCDGPVDAIWIENLNTVLDDNKILTLANGERIQMTENCKMVFEVENLNNASPATVSRCGQVYVSPVDLGYESIFKGWLKNRKSQNQQRADEVDKLDKIFNKYFIQMRIVESTEKIMKEPAMSTSAVQKVLNVLNMLTGCLRPLIQSNKLLDEKQLERFVIYSLCWSIGGLYEGNDRAIFYEYLLTKQIELPPKGKELDTIFDFYVSPDHFDWKFNNPEEWKPGSGNIQFSQILMPTEDSFKAKKLLDFILGQEKTHTCNNACLLLGVAGSAKTSSVLMYSQDFDKSKMLFKRINFSSATSPQMFQEIIDTECDFKFTQKDFGPPSGKCLTVFIDDISMPFVNKWGDQITLEIVRQLIEQGGFYMLDKTMRGNFKNIKNLFYIGAMNHPGGGRNDIPNRLKRQMFIFNMILPAVIDGIFKPIIKHIFKEKYFSSETNRIVETLTSATVGLWNKVKQSMLPTPQKFHYVFNMRELSRIFKGILQVRKEIITSSSTVGVNNCKPEVFLVGLWRNESERVFADKLINNKDKDTVRNYINEMCAEHFSQLEAEINEKFANDKTFEFCDFLREDTKNEEGIVEIQAEKIYEAINDKEKLRARIYNLLDDYNAKYTSKKMPLVIFDDAMKHLLRISRSIQQARSSALLVGVGGSGKQSLTRLAAEIGRHWCHQIVVTKSFNEKDLKEEIKRLFTNAGHQGKPTTFLMTDAEVKKEEFLEYINMILSTGEIPGLLAKDEKEVIQADIRNEYVKIKVLGNVDPSPQDLWAYFVERCRDNLHIVLCFSPVGQKFRDRARKFPALFNECTIDWFLPWPEEALVSVAETFIKNFSKLDTSAETKKLLMQHMGNVHLMVNTACDLYLQKMRRAVYVTPKSFLSYLNSYKDLYINKYQGLDKQESSFKVGLAKIKEASVSIAHMEVGLKEEETQLKEASDKTDKLMIDLSIEQKKANQKADDVEQTTKQCQEQADMISREREAAEKDLQAAMPALEKAHQAVAGLKPADIVEMKTNRSPLDIIKYIMDAVVIFFQGKIAAISIEDKVFNKKENKVVQFMKDSWEEGGRATLNDMQFMKNLVDFKRDQINDETIELLEPYMKQQGDWFNEETGKKASVAASGILKWALAINEYHEKSKIVKPKKIFLAIQEGRLAVAQKELARAQAELKDIQQYLAKLKEKFSVQQEAKNALEARAAKTKKKINTARQLIYSLTSEKERWDKGAQEIGEQKRRLVGNSSLATAFISYCGPFNADFRNMLAVDFFTGDMKKKQIPVTPGLDLVQFLVDDATIGEWNLQGLPKDDLSIQNGIMVTNSTRYPLFIDPQSQGSSWIKKKLEEFIDVNRSITTLQHPRFKDYFLKYCMEEGKCLIIENIENEVDPMLDPVLEKQVQIKGKTRFIDVGGTQLEYQPEFKLFMTCRLSNPAFSPELSAKTTIIDFTVTQGGLEQQLLGKVISKEQKSLEDSLNQLLSDVNQSKKELQNLDAKLLDRLTTSTGNLLDDTELMDVLNNTKTRAKEVAASILDAEIKSKEINEKREQYRPVAIRGSALYFTMIEVAQVNWMYNSSLEQFLNLFMLSINNSEKAQLPSKRVENIIEYLTYFVYKYVNRGLFEKDKITFILMMCFKIMLTAMKITGADISMFLKSGAALDIKTAEKAKPFAFLQDKVWLNILALSKHSFGPGKEASPFFRELPDRVSQNEQLWKQWIDKNDPENFPVPEFAERMIAEKEIGSFMLLCLVRSLREDRTLVSASMFINYILGKMFTDPLSYPIDKIWEESTSLDPVLFLLSAGADPTSSIDELAKKKKKFPTEKVSMGEGQERFAKKAIEERAKDGGWVILQNCHLGLKFMEEIETMIVPEGSTLNTAIHEDFRLWITCQQDPRFPLGLLQKTIKVTNEPPRGLKAGLLKTFTTIITQEFVDKVDHPNWRSLIFTVCFLHSIVIERKKFGPLGWCIPYEYNYSDLEASLLFIEKYLTNLMSVPQVNSPNLPVSMSVVKYMICEVQYGGRITDDLDRELFNAYGDDYLKEGIFGNEYTFAEIQTDTGGGSKEKFKYKIPANQTAELSKYNEYCQNVPSNDNPEVFGLHANADLTFRLKESLEMMNTIMENRPKDSSSGGGKTREEIVQDKAKDLLSKLPPDYIDNDVREMVKKLPGPKQLSDRGLSVPLNIFLYQELQRMQKIIGIVKKTLNDTVDAIDGVIIMTPDILDAINAIFDAKVPNTWLVDPSGAEISWILPTLGSWFSSLLDRNKQLNDWLKTNTRPNTYWLTGFFNPQGFLTGMKQEVTRMHKKPEKQQEAWSLDDVIYQTEVKEKEYELIKEIPSEGIFIHGLFLEGCRWLKTGLDDSEPKKMFAPLPILYVTAQNKKKQNDSERSNKYQCPVYKYPRKTDRYIIFRVGLQCEGSQPHKWKLRGVSLLCSTE